MVGLVTLALAGAACDDDPATDPGARAPHEATAGTLQIRPVLHVLADDAPDELTCAGNAAAACVAAHVDERIVLEMSDGPARYALGPAVLTEEAIASARAVDDGAGGWDIGATLTPSGATRFAEITRDSVGERLGIVVDGVLRSTPTVQVEISSGQLVILNLGGRPTAEAVAQELSGAS